MKSRKRLVASIFSVILALILTLSSSALSLGDVDGDGRITSSDARTVLRASVGLEDYVPDSAEYAACDVDGNGTVTAADARIVLRIAVGLEDIKDYDKTESTPGDCTTPTNPIPSGNDDYVPGNTTDPEEVHYVINTNTGKFHYPSCTSVAKISEKNRSDSTASREELIAAGYSPCGICKP